MTLANFLQEVISIMEAAEVPYMLTGSLAAAYYAVPRATQDINFVVEISPASLPDFTELLSSEGYYVSLAEAKKGVVSFQRMN